jgi:hypothetical protein
MYFRKRGGPQNGCLYEISPLTKDQTDSHNIEKLKSVYRKKPEDPFKLFPKHLRYSSKSVLKKADNYLRKKYSEILKND